MSSQATDTSALTIAESAPSTVHAEGFLTIHVARPLTVKNTSLLHPLENLPGQFAGQVYFTGLSFFDFFGSNAREPRQEPLQDLPCQGPRNPMHMEMGLPATVG